MKERAPVLQGIVTLAGRLWPKSILGRAVVVSLGALAVLAGLLLFLIALVLSGNVAGAFFGPVNVWNSPSVPPPDTAMIGVYTLTPKSAQYIEKLSSVRANASRMTLRPDHRAKLRNVYEYVEPFSASAQSPLCQISGRGSWKAINSGGVVLALRLDTNATILGPNSCSTAVWTDYAILGRSGSRSLWSYIGDPDSDTGLEYSR